GTASRRCTRGTVQTSPVPDKSCSRRCPAQCGCPWWIAASGSASEYCAWRNSWGGRREHRPPSSRSSLRDSWTPRHRATGSGCARPPPARATTRPEYVPAPLVWTSSGGRRCRLAPAREPTVLAGMDSAGTGPPLDAPPGDGESIALRDYQGQNPPTPAPLGYLGSAAATRSARESVARHDSRNGRQSADPSP